MNNPELYNESNESTYCPEDDKIRLYVGRVPREEFLKLRAEGWKSTPKQDCDFVAVWTPDREETALSYSGWIGDEDQSPTDRAADRAERFTGYLDKRRTEAGYHADRYDAGPMVYGHQDKGRATRQADRHDRQAWRACNAWSKAEYWERRTRGVIESALYKSRPDVRFGRIKKLEAEKRKLEKSAKEYARLYKTWQAIESGKLNAEKAARWICLQWSKVEYNGERVNVTDLVKVNWTGEPNPNGIESAEIAQLWISEAQTPGDPESKSERALAHLDLRLAYENQMLGEQGGTAGLLEIEAGGKFGKHLIWKVNKSPATGRPVSVQVKGTTSGFSARSGYKKEETWEVLRTIEIDRYPQSAYVAPTSESLAELKAEKAAWKKANAKPKAPKLVNPTDEDAERLQEIWNERAADSFSASESRYTSREPEKVEILRMTQAQYSARSKGSFSSCETREVCREGKLEERASNMWSSAAEKRRKARGPAVCKVRISTKGSGFYGPPAVVILTDKPQKPLPRETWETYTPEIEQAAELATV